MAISGMVGAVFVSDRDTAPASFSNEPTTSSAGYTRYRITDPDLLYWPKDTAITVKVNSITVTEGFTLERTGGFVVFDVPLDAEDVVTVSGEALTLIECGGFFNWNVDAEGDAEECTTYASNGWKERKQVQKGWGGSAESYWGDDRFFANIGDLMVMKLFVDKGEAQSCLEGFALITSDNIESAKDQIITESIDFTGTGPLYPRL